MEKIRTLLFVITGAFAFVGNSAATPYESALNAPMGGYVNRHSALVSGYDNRGQSVFLPPDIAYDGIRSLDQLSVFAGGIVNFRPESGRGIEERSASFGALSARPTESGQSGVSYYSANYAGYGSEIAVSPIPEPEIYAMLVAGLGMMGLVVRRRRSPEDTAI